MIFYMHHTLNYYKYHNEDFLELLITNLV